MLRHRRPRASAFVAVAVVAAVVLAGCSSTVGGQAAPVPGVAAPSPAASPSPSSGSQASPTSTPGPSGGITVPSSPSRVPAASQEPDGAAGTIGYPGIGDPYYPTAGNGGYQVDSYNITLSYDPATNDLQSTAQIKGTVTSDEGLTQFDLDLQPSMTVSSVQVDGADADFEQQSAELVVTPASALASQAAMTVDIGYGGQPELIPGGTSALGDGGWYRTSSGGAVAIGEPFAASAWYPVNEHPADPATFSVTATVPQDWQVISNGIRETDGLPDPGAGHSVFRWSIKEPIASYLTTIYIDKFTVVTDALADGTPIISALGPDAQDDKQLAEDTRRVIEVLSGYFGPYPFESVGGIYTGQKVGFALETATRPVYGDFVDLDFVVHELAHQWYGDKVTIERWSDICLNECFASYASWLWKEKVDGANLDDYWKQQMAAVADDVNYWKSPLVDMGAGEEFTRVYDRGPLALHA
ncbi:MAG TPA: M1 family metallopeptidase, partial [Nakamurella sp.]|nr:M1 family metallopeptidase [Nakamurella sp.]